MKRAKVTLENGKTLSIEAKDQSSKNVYVQKIIVNGKEWKENYFEHSDLVNGAEIVFEMGPKSKK